MHNKNTTASGAANTISGASEAILEQLEDALVEWSGYVTADDAPRTLREHASPHIKMLRAELGRLHALAAAAPVAPTPPAKIKCEYCDGTGVDGDAGDDGRTIDVACGNCDGLGYPRYQTACPDGKRCLNGCLNGDTCRYTPEGFVQAPHYRGYANLGTGQYVLNHTAPHEPAELIISIASEEDKAGRTIGDERCNPAGKAIQPDEMAVRLAFTSVAGLDALEKQLRYLREVHFPQAAPVAPAVGNSGFDYKTAADLLNGKTVRDEAIRKFVAASRWAHDDRAGLGATLLSARGELASREAEIALLKKTLVDAEPAPQPAPLQQGEYPETLYEGGRESVDDALAVVESFGPGVQGLNDTFARQVLLGQEVRRLRTAYEHACQGRSDFRNLYRAARGAAQAAPAPVAEDADQPHGFIKPDTGTHVYFYEQDFYVLSNFSAFTLYWDDVENMRFDTSEAAYHWEKFPGHDDIRAAIINAPSAHEAFKVAERNKAHRRPDWDDVKVDVMRRILRAKVEQHEYVRRKLLATGDRILVEDSWRDNVWGWGPNRDGQNLLGKLWMEVRDELRAQAAQPEGGA